MPHDKNGKELAKGDLVALSAKIIEIYPGADRCDISVEAGEGDNRQTYVLTAGLVDLVSPAPSLDAPPVGEAVPAETAAPSATAVSAVDHRPAETQS